MNMNKNKLIVFMMLCMALLFNRQAQAQYVLTESFADAGALSKTGWQLSSSGSTTYRDVVNGNAETGEGSLLVSFNMMRAGTIDSLRLPLFTSSGADTLQFDHAHRARNGGIDTMSVFYSTDNGVTLQLLQTFTGSVVPGPGTLSTVSSTITPGKFIPNNAAQWKHEQVALPAGTNAVVFVFYTGGGDELYMDNIRIGQAPVICSGYPYIGTVPSTILSCPGTSFYVLPDSFEFNPMVTYQWTTSADNGVFDPWVPVATGYGANTPEYFITGFTQPAWIRLEATCSGSTTISNVVRVMFDSLYTCYCSTNLGGACNMYITNVTLNNGLNLNNTSACNNADLNNIFSPFRPGAGTTDTIVAGDPYGFDISVSTQTPGSWITGRIGHWIDYNKNGVFDSTEFTLLKNAFATGTITQHLTVPISAAPGVAGMRLRFIDQGTMFPNSPAPPSLLDGRHACADAAFGGETEDYLLFIRPAPVCSGTPSAGNIAATQFAVCNGSDIEIRTTGVSFGDGISYQWEASADLGVMDPWHAIAGANGVSVAITNITAETYYRLKVLCAHTNDSAFSDTVHVTINPFYACYCADDLGGNACNPSTSYISNVTVDASAINNTTTCSANPNSRSFFDIAANTYDTVYQDEVITLNVTVAQTASKVGVWIDYNRDSVYSASEFTLVSGQTDTGVAAVKNIQIPLTASTGLTGMRIRAVDLREIFDGGDACKRFNSGETEDYVINIQAPVLCSGAPSAGNYPSAAQICAGDSVNISVSGASFEPGIVYQWQESDDNGVNDPWADVTTGSGLQSRNFTSSAVMDTIYYRLRVTCTNSAIATYGHAMMVSMKPFHECYCTKAMGAAYSCTWGQYISNVRFPGKNLNTTSTCSMPAVNDSYTKYPPVGAATDTITAGQLLDIAVTMEGLQSRIVLWIDYNHNSLFEPSEYTEITPNIAAGGTATATIQVPVTALSGLTGMRIRSTGYSAVLTETDACLELGEGETEDYFIYINDAPVCNGTPAAGAIAGSLLICPGQPFSIINNGAAFGSGVHYYWEESDDDGVTDAWDVVAGTSDSRTGTIPGTISTKYYRMKTVCVNVPDSAVTNSMLVTVDSFYNCYTAGMDLGGGNCYGNDYIKRVFITGTTLDNASLCNTTPFGSRSNYPPSGNTTATLVAGGEYTINVTHGNNRTVVAWIDYDHNGFFDPSEYILINTNSRNNQTASKDFAVPANAVYGLTGMRVRTNDPFLGTNSGSGAANFGAGETEDYVVMIDSLRQVSNVMVSDIRNNSITVSWSNGNGNNRLVIAKRAADALADPVQNTLYGSDQVFGSGNGDSTGLGNYVVYAGNRDTFINVLNLEELQQYEFYVYEYAANSVATTYKLPGVFTSGTTLPVSMLSFSGSVSGDHAVLNWITASESNNKGFYIERSSDGRTFGKIGFVKGAGNSHTQQNYQYKDAGVFSKTSTVYYRLKQEDFDGQTSYSRVVKVSTEQPKTTIVRAQPNPFGQQLSIDLNSAEESQVNLRLVNIYGQTVVEKNMNVKKGHHAITIDDLAGIPSGVYFLVITTEGSSTYYKLLH